MTIAENLNRILEAKADIKQAIENKGVTVGNIMIDGYAEKINEIPQEVIGSGKWVIPDGTKFKDSTFSVIDTENMDVSNVTKMNYFFYGCDNVKSFSVSSWDTSKVTTMENMFMGTNVSSLDLSTWNTSSLNNIGGMFAVNNTLKNVNVTGWDTSKVTDMSGVFSLCQNLNTISGYEKWDTSNVTDMNGVFGSCNDITSLDLTNWDTSNVTDISGMFKECYRLTTINGINDWDTSKVTTMFKVFADSHKLENIDLTN